MVSYLHACYRVSERRACRVARLAISTFRYHSLREPRTALRMRMREIAQTRVRYGYRKIRVLLNREGWKVGKKLLYRLYREEGLALRYKPRRKRRASLQRRERCRPIAPNQVWSLDFVSDQLADGRRFRGLTVLDVFTRESLAIEVGQRLKGDDVGASLECHPPKARRSEVIREELGFTCDDLRTLLNSGMAPAEIHKLMVCRATDGLAVA